MFETGQVVTCRVSSLVNHYASCFLNDNECVETQFLRAFVCFRISIWFRNTDEGNKTIKDMQMNLEKIKAVLSTEECVGLRGTGTDS